MAAPSRIPLANSPTLKRSFTAVTSSTPPSPDKTAASGGVALPQRPLADQHKQYFPKRRLASNYILPNMPVAAGPQAYQSQFPSFMSVYGLDPSSMDRREVIATDSKLGTLREDTSRQSPDNENGSPNASPHHNHRDSTSTQASESTDSSPTTTISTADSSSLTDPSPSSSPESPVTIIPLSSFSATTFGIHSLDDLTMSEHINHDHLQPFGYDRPMTSPSPRKARNAKGLALKLPSIGDNLEQGQPQLLSPPALASPTFVKPPPPKPRKKPSLLSLQTSANSNPTAVPPRLALQPPPTPSLVRPMTLKHAHSSPQILFSPDPRGSSLPPGGMQLPHFERSRISGLSSAFRRPSTLNESAAMGAGYTIEEEDMPIRTQMATRSIADIGGDPFDVPPQEDAQSPSYPEGPVAIYEPNVYLYLEPTAEEASKFDTVINVASEVKNPFKPLSNANQSKAAGGLKQVSEQMDLDRENIPVPDTAISISTFQTAFEWPTDSQQTPTESSPTTPKPAARSEPEYIHIPWEHNTDISKELMGLCEIIDSRSKEGKKVLVHCQQGASRSASLIIAYGMFKDPSLSVNDAYHAAQAKSKWISPNMKLMYALQDFQKDLEKKKLLTTSGFKRGGGRSPTKHRTTLSADAVDYSPKEPLTAPLPDRENNTPVGTPSRLRGNSSPSFGDVLPGPSSAPSSFAWTPKAERAPFQSGLWGSFPVEEDLQTKSAVTQSDFGFSQFGSSFGQDASSVASDRPVASESGFGSFQHPSYDTPPDSGFSSHRNQLQGTAFNAFPSLTLSGDALQDVSLMSDKTAIFQTQFASLPVNDTPPTPSLWSPRIQEFTANPLRQPYAYGRTTDDVPPSPSLMSPRVTTFVNSFRPAPTTNFSRPLNARPVSVAPVVDPRSPPMKGEAPIIRSIDDVL